MSLNKHETVYGTVATEKLDELQQNFDTTQILTAMDTIDEIRSRICEPDGIRLELLNLHSMAHTIINGDSTMNAPIGTCIWEVAQELELEIAKVLPSWMKLLQCLESLENLLQLMKMTTTLIFMNNPLLSSLGETNR